MEEPATLLRLEIEASGKRIHKAGFRSAAEDAAADAGITGTVENLSRMDSTGRNVRSARIICEGTKEEILEFIKILNGKNLFFVLDRISEEAISNAKPVPKREFPEFQTLRGKNETPERLDEAAIYMRQSYNEMHGLKTEMSSFRTQTGKDFAVMEGKYHTISNNLDLAVGILAEYLKSMKPELKSTIEKLQKEHRLGGQQSS